MGNCVPAKFGAEVYGVVRRKLTKILNPPTRIAVRQEVYSGVQSTPEAAQQLPGEP